jgi:hypothetical protein
MHLKSSLENLKGRESLHKLGYRWKDIEMDLREVCVKVRIGLNLLRMCSNDRLQ